MKMNKLTSALLISGITLSLGGTLLSSVQTANAATTISSSKFETVMSYTKQELEKSTGMKLTSSTLNQTYNVLKRAATWERLGQNKSDAQKIASRISNSSNQTLGILKDILAHPGTQFKVVVINQPNYSGVNIGTTGNQPTPEKPTNEEKGESSENPSSPKLNAAIKEIDIDLDYRNDKDIEIDYEVKSDGRIKAEVENDQTHSKVKGAAASTIVENILDGLDPQNMSRESIENHVVNKLNVSKSGLKKFDFKVKYTDGSTIDFKLKH